MNSEMTAKLNSVVDSQQRLGWCALGQYYNSARLPETASPNWLVIILSFYWMAMLYYQGPRHLWS